MHFFFTILLFLHSVEQQFFVFLVVYFLFFNNLIVTFFFLGFCFALFIHCRYRKKQQRKANGIIGSKQLLKFAALPSKKYKNLHKKQCFSNTISSQKMHKIIELNKKLSTGLQIEQK